MLLVFRRIMMFRFRITWTFERLPRRHTCRCIRRIWICRWICRRIQIVDRLVEQSLSPAIFFIHLKFKFERNVFVTETIGFQIGDLESKFSTHSVWVTMWFKMGLTSSLLWWVGCLVGSAYDRSSASRAKVCVRFVKLTFLKDLSSRRIQATLFSDPVQAVCLQKQFQSFEIFEFKENRKI